MNLNLKVKHMKLTYPMIAPKIPNSDTRSDTLGGLDSPGLMMYPLEIGGKIRSIKIHADLSVAFIFYK